MINDAINISTQLVIENAERKSIMALNRPQK
jgi:hypothetical protein